MGKILVSLSGGMDSAALLARAIANTDNHVEAIAFNYGQRHVSELKAAEAVADHFGVRFSIVELPSSLFIGAGSSLMEGSLETSFGSYDELANRHGAQPTVVPFRNGVFLAILTAYAVGHGFNEVWIAVHAGDANNWHYPDCSAEFIGSMSSAIFIGSDQKVRLRAPYVYMSKGEVCVDGLDHDTPFELTQTCYQGANPACGKCASCLERLDAFKFAGVVDPIKYAT